MKDQAKFPWWGRALLTFFRGNGAETIRGDLEETFWVRVGHDASTARRATFRDIVQSLFSWWQPSAIRRRHAYRHQHHAPFSRKPRMSLPHLSGDLAVTARSLVRRPGFTLIVFITLGLGIGATTTIYSVVDTVIVRQLPYANAERLVAVGNTFPGREWADADADLQALAGVSLLNFQDWKARARTLTAITAVELASSLIPDQGNGPELVPLAQVTPDFFELLGVAPTLGRTFLPDDHNAASGRVAMIPYATWMQRYGGDPSVVGRTQSHAGATPYVIVGVLPQDFLQPAALGTSPVEFWTPIDPTHARYNSRGRRSLYVFGQLADGISLSSARVELDEIQAQLATEYPDGNVYPNGDRLGAGVNLLHADTVGTASQALLTFFGASVLLLLIAGLNATNLLFVRGLDRQAELGIRLALGANRTRLVRMLLTEGLLLSIGGGLLGIAIAYGGVATFVRIAPSTLPRLNEMSVNQNVIVISTLVSIVAGIIVALVPALKLTKRDLSTTIRENLGTTGVAGGNHLRTALVTSQLSLAVILTVGASLLFHSFVQVATVDPGFDDRDLTTFSMPLKRPNAPEAEATWQAWDALLQEVRALPGLTQVAATSVLPYSSPQWAPWVLLPGEPLDHRREGVAGYVVTPNFFEVAGVSVVNGRSFQESDGPGGAGVVIVNEAFANTHLTGQNPVGTTIRFRDGGADPSSHEIVGVVADVIQTRAEEGALSAVYVPYTQAEWPAAQVLVRSEQDLGTLGPELRRAGARFSPYVPILNLQSMSAQIHSVRTEPRFRAALLGSFAIIALTLAAIGLYGSLAHTVEKRTREMGIRVALGSSRVGIFKLVMRQGMTVLVIGTGIGLVGSLMLTQLLSGFLFGIGRFNLTSFGGAVALLSLAAFVAIVIPARQATSVDVMNNLRAD